MCILLGLGLRRIKEQLHWVLASPSPKTQPRMINYSVPTLSTVCKHTAPSISQVMPCWWPPVSTAAWEWPVMTRSWVWCDIIYMYTWWSLVHLYCKTESGTGSLTALDFTHKSLHDLVAVEALAAAVLRGSQCDNVLHISINILNISYTFSVFEGCKKCNLILEEVQGEESSDKVQISYETVKV